MNAVMYQGQTETAKCFVCNQFRKIVEVKRGAFKTIITLECGHARTI